MASCPDTDIDPIFVCKLISSEKNFYNFRRSQQNDSLIKLNYIVFLNVVSLLTARVKLE